MRLIDADALLESICQDECERSYKDCDYTCSSAQPVVNAPTIEAVPLNLLKEHEPVKPETARSGGGSTWWNVCGACKTAINPNDKYCHECGAAIDWGRDDA